MLCPSPPDPDPVPLSRKQFGTDARGETAIEYGLIASLIVVALIAALPVFGGGANKIYSKISNALVSSSP